MNLREQAILTAIRETMNEDKPLTVENIYAKCSALPNFGELTETELDAILVQYGLQRPSTTESVEPTPTYPEEDHELPVVLETSQDQDPDKPAPPNYADMESMIARRDNADSMLHASRSRFMAATHSLNYARNVLQEKLSKFLHDTITPLENIRQHLASQQQQRRDEVEGRVAPRKHAVVPSVIDAITSRSGSVESFVMKQHATGHRRGGYPSSMRGMKLPPQK